MKKDMDYYDGLPWRVIIDPERQDDGRIHFCRFPSGFRRSAWHRGDIRGGVG